METLAYRSDLENAGATVSNLEIGGNSEMMRIFKRLLRSSGKQRVTGVWIL